MARIGRFAPPLLLMALMYYLSDQPGLSSGVGKEGDTVLRKAAHLAEYALLWFLWARALGYRARARQAAAVIAIAFAVSDELHQSTVEDREGKATDVLIDAVGIALGWLAWRFVRDRGRERVAR